MGRRRETRLAGPSLRRVGQNSSENGATVNMLEEEEVPYFRGSDSCRTSLSC